VKTIILAGGQGTRLAEETEVRPKPMVEIGHRPILWHILKIYAHYGESDFLIALGYKGDHIKRYIADYASLATNLTVDLGSGTIESHREGDVEDWRVTLIDTGRHTETGGRMLKLAPYLDGETFMMTFGDGVANVDISDLIAFHRSHGKLATLTAVRPPARFGHVDLNGDQVVQFSEKPQLREGWINGGFFVLEREVLEYIDGEDTDFVREPLEHLSRDGQLMAYRHSGFWQCMDTLRDKLLLEQMWNTDSAPWNVWSVPQDGYRRPALTVSRYYKSTHRAELGRIRPNIWGEKR
jgi:glucose-1-phosphate cytidylyltransferase